MQSAPALSKKNASSPPRPRTIMSAYIVRRLLLMIPTLFAIMVINFVIIQVAPGGPVEQIISQLTGVGACLLYTSPSPRDATLSRMPSSA